MLGDLVSRRIAFDASDQVLLDALSDLNLTVRGLVSDDQEPSLGRRWIVTYGPLNDNYDIPLIRGDPSGLTGNNPRVWTHTALEGRGPLAGSFRLKFQGSNWTSPMGYNASANDVRTALENLATIDQVLVTRSGPSPARG
jgi:hypothetical protein